MPVRVDFLPDHGHAIFYPHSPLAISDVMETIKVSSTGGSIERGENQGRCGGDVFSTAPCCTAKKYHETLEHIHWNPVKGGLVAKQDWRWSSVHDFSARAEGATAANNVLVVDHVDLPLDERTRI